MRLVHWHYGGATTIRRCARSASSWINRVIAAPVTRPPFVHRPHGALPTPRSKGPSLDRADKILRIDRVDRIARIRSHVSRTGPTPRAAAGRCTTARAGRSTTKSVKHAPARGLTVRGFVAEWLPKRRERGLDWKADEGRLNRHVLPYIGDLLIADVRARHLVDMFHRLRTDPNIKLAPRSIYNIYSVVSAVFRDAKLADLVEQSPCVLDERHLGPLIDKEPEWRSSAVFTHEEAETIISDARIPPDRQMAYAIELLAGTRPGKPRRCAGATTIRRCARWASSWWRSRTAPASARRRPRRMRSSTFRFIPRSPRCWPSGSSADGPR